MRRLIYLAVAALLWTSCGTQKEYAYLKDAPRDEEMPIVNNYSSTVFPNDLLYIYVSSNMPETVLPFNEETNKGKEVEMKGIRGYRVSQDGKIHFPILGDVQAAGRTRDELGRYIEARLKEQRLVKDPVVTVSLMNFHVSIIGEVTNPSVLTSDGNRLTIFEAIAQCGDITMYGQRNMVTVMRFGEDNVKVDTVDLTSKSVLDSPYYYLQQGDIVYVEPTRKKKREAYRDEDWPKYVSTGVSALSLAYMTYYRYITIQRRLNRN